MLEISIPHGLEVSPSEPSSVVFPIEQRSVKVKWDRLARHLETYYHAPDLEALRTCIAAGAAHFLYPKAPASWLMMLGAPGSGKTSQIMPALRAFPNFELLDQITPATFVSGWFNEKKETSLIKRLGESILFGVSDFSGIRSLTKERMAEVASQLRAIYDGHLKKTFGVTDRAVEWRGKATMIVCSTSDVERHWSVQRSLGERFLYVRWRMGDSDELGLMAGEQEDQGGIKEKTSDLTAEWLGTYITWDGGPIARREEMEKLGFHKVASLLALLRKPVVWASGEIVEVVGGGESEGPGRIVQTMYNTARAHAHLFRRSHLEKEDIAVALRMVQDSAPLSRMRLMNFLLEGDRESKSKADVMTELERRGDFTQSSSTLDRQLNELAAIGLISIYESGGQRWFTVRPQIRERFSLLRGDYLNETKNPQTAS